MNSFTSLLGVILKAELSSTKRSHTCVMCVLIYKKLQHALLVPSGVLIVIDRRYID